jgi:preprotein translocase subunit Sec61beta
MARDNRINMPQSGGGLTRYFDNAGSKITIPPNQVVLLIVGLTIIILLIKFYLA